MRNGVARLGSTQRPLPGWPRGVFAAIDDDSTTAVIGWHRILAATGLSCAFATPVPALGPGSRWLLALALAAVAVVLRSPRARERFL